MQKAETQQLQPRTDTHRPGDFGFEIVNVPFEIIPVMLESGTLAFETCWFPSMASHRSAVSHISVCAHILFML